MCHCRVEGRSEKNLFDFCISDLSYNKHGKSKFLMGKKNGYCFCSLFFKNKGGSNPSRLFLLNTHLPVILGQQEIRMVSQKTDVMFYIW